MLSDVTRQHSLLTDLFTYSLLIFKYARQYNHCQGLLLEESHLFIKSRRVEAIAMVQLPGAFLDEGIALTHVAIRG